MSAYESFSDESKDKGKSRWLLPLLLLTVVVGAFYMEIPQKWWPPVQQFLGLGEESNDSNKTLSLLPPEESRTELADDRFEQAHQTALDAMKMLDSEVQGKQVSTGDELLDMEALINDKLNQLSQTQKEREHLKEEISDLQVEIEHSNQRVAKKQQRMETLQAR